MAKTQQLANPWLNISWSNRIVDCDKDFRIRIGRQTLLIGSPDYVKHINKNTGNYESLPLH